MTLGAHDQARVRAAVHGSRWRNDSTEWPRLVVVVRVRGEVEIERRTWLAGKIRPRAREIAHALITARVGAGFVLVVDARGLGPRLELVDVGGVGR